MHKNTLLQGHMPRQTLRQALLWLFCLSILLTGGCASLQTQEEAPVGPYSLEGPPLFIVGSYKGEAVEGTMERYCMVGIGKMEIAGVNRAAGFFGEARLQSEPSEKGRIRGVLQCPEGENILFSMRNTGPDQGVGIGKNEAGDGMLVFFFHSCKEEAQRRFPAVARSLQAAATRQQQGK